MLCPLCKRDGLNTEGLVWHKKFFQGVMTVYWKCDNKHLWKTVEPLPEDAFLL